MAGAASESERMEVEGTDIIRKAAIEAGAQPDNIDVIWKADQIIVTISGDLVNLGGSSLEDLDEDEVAEELDMYFDADELEAIEDELEGEEDDDDEPSITGIARAINRALAELGEGSIGDIIAQTHSIEVTTPGASDVLQGDVMFEAYKGFEVIVETTETNKKGKKKVKEGLLVERTDEHTVINQKGRISKIKNEKVECVRLPKAKKEKGVK
jgi:ribosome maturation factor RimP